MSTDAAVTIETDDGLTLDGDGAEVTGTTEGPWASVVLCHPHPQYGGNRHAGLISHLYRALPALGVRTLRFDFRGVGRSDGRHGGGDPERRDVAAAIGTWAVDHDRGPLVTVGWSFGGDVSLATDHPALDRWCAIAPPLRVLEPSAMVAGADPRPTLVGVPEHDEFRPPDEAEAVLADWQATIVTTIGGASHLLIGRYEATTDLVVDFLRGR
jgi:alpha/beta superfamily hydrolase